MASGTHRQFVHQSWRTWSIRLIMALLLCGLTAIDPSMAVHGVTRAQREPAVIEAVIPAAVQVAISVDRVTESGQHQADIVARGSGTIISADGLILTAAHVVDFPTLKAELRERAVEESPWFGQFEYAFETVQIIILGTDGYSLPQPRYLATILEHNRALDVALLQITSDDLGNAFDPEHLSLPFVPLASTELPAIGEQVTLLSYPGMAGGGLLTTTGTVSGYRFDYEWEPRHATALLVDVTISAGSSGGTVINARGELVGIALAATILDCRSSERIFVEECSPSGGSVAMLAPMAALRDVLAESDAAGLQLAATPVSTP